MLQNKQITKGFTLIEVMVAIAISTFIIYGIYTMLFASYDAYQIATEQMELQRDARKAIDIMISQLRMSNIDNIMCFPAWNASVPGTTFNILNDEAICFPSAYDAAGNFQTDAHDSTPEWQAIIVYSPFVDNGQRQLRRYTIFGAYDFPMTIMNITPNTVHLRDASGHPVNIQRGHVNAVFDVLANDFNGLTFTSGNPLGITLNLSGTTKRGVPFSGSLSSSAALRNQ